MFKYVKRVYFKKLREARYKFLKDGSYFGEIAGLQGRMGKRK